MTRGRLQPRAFDISRWLRGDLCSVVTWDGVGPLGNVGRRRRRSRERQNGKADGGMPAVFSRDQGRDGGDIPRPRKLTRSAAVSFPGTAWMFTLSPVSASFGEPLAAGGLGQAWRASCPSPARPSHKPPGISGAEITSLSFCILPAAQHSRLRLRIGSGECAARPDATRCSCQRQSSRTLCFRFQVPFWPSRPPRCGTVTRQKAGDGPRRKHEHTVR